MNLRQEVAELTALADALEHRALALCLAAIAAGAGRDELVRGTLQLLATKAHAFDVRQAAVAELFRSPASR